MTQERARGDIIGYRATFVKQVGGTVGRLHKGLQNGYRRLRSYCRKRARVCEADGCPCAEEEGFERPVKKPRLAATSVEVHAWPTISAMPAHLTEPPSGVPVGAAPSAAPAADQVSAVPETPAAEGALLVPEGPLQTDTPAVTHDMTSAPTARAYTHAIGLEYSRRSNEGLARARQFMSEMRARVDLLMQEDFRSAAQAPNRESIHGEDSPYLDAVVTDVPMSVHNLPGSCGGSFRGLAGLSTPLGGSGVGPQASEQGEPQQRLEHVGGAMAGQEATTALEIPADILSHPPPRVQPLQPDQLLSPPVSSTPQPTPVSNPEAGSDPAALCHQEAVPLRAHSREKSAEAEAADTAGVQQGPVSQPGGQSDGAAPADSISDDSVSCGGSSDWSVKGAGSGGSKGHSSGAGSGEDRSTNETSSGGSHDNGSDGGSGGSHAGGGSAVQSALELPGFPPSASPRPETGHGKDIDSASGVGGGGEQGGVVGGGSGGALGAAQTHTPNFDHLNHNLMPFDQWLIQWKVDEAAKAAAAKGQHVSGSANCNAKQEADAFLADLGLHTAVEGEGTAGSRGSQGDDTRGGADAEMPLEANINVARHMVNAECDDPLPDADMEEDEYDYSYPGAEMEGDWCTTAVPHSTPPDAAPLAPPAPVPRTSAAPTPTPPVSGAAPMAAARPFSRGSQHASLGMPSIPAHTPPSLYAEPTGPDGLVHIARPFSRGRRDAPPMAFATSPGMAGPILPPDQHAPVGMPYILPPTAQIARPFSRGRRAPPPPPPQAEWVAPFPDSPDVQSRSSHESQNMGRKRKHNATSEAQKRRRLPESGGADSAQQWAVSSAWCSHGGLQAAVQAVADSTAPAGPAAVASGSAAVAEAAAGSGEGLQSAGLAGAALAGQTASQGGGRFAASSFGSSKVQAAVNGGAAGIQSSYKFSF